MTASTFVRSAAQAAVITLVSSAGAQAQTPLVFHACIAPLTGLMYEPKEPGRCFHHTHRPVTWTDGQGAFQAATPLGGDLHGPLPNPAVVRLQRRPVSASNPAVGDMLAWNGSEWAPARPTASVLQSPNGEYSISITDAGLELRGPNLTRIRLIATGIEIHSGLLLDMRAGTTTSVRAGSTLRLEGPLGADVITGGILGLRGVLSILNGGGCPVARLGSQIAGGVDAEGRISGQIITGSPTVFVPC